jgi:hypothetical protein
MSLSITYDSLRKDIGRYLGFDRDPSNWNEDEDDDVQSVLDAGLRQFYRPPRIAGDRYSHQWSFLKPIGTITLTESVGDYDMPTDFADLDGDLYYHESELAPRRIRQVNEGRILELRQRDWYTATATYPQEAAIVPKKSDGTADQLYQLWIWPLPSQAFVLKFRYTARQQALSCDNEVPLGGSEHAEAIRASCLASAESFLDDERGTKWQEFMDQLQSSVDFDRRANSPSTLGYNGDNSDRRVDPYLRSPNITVYEKFPL